MGKLISAQWAFDEVLPSAVLRHKAQAAALRHACLIQKICVDMKTSLRRASSRRTRKHLETLPMSHATQEIIGVMHAVTQGFDANVAHHVKKANTSSRTHGSAP